ncbi:hypothetical protein HYPSUDRAFT_46682 [Hypholoma sublateritium FD-334 SS-4]|uniref:SAP domain-containing protein n=1 Tax=Hypholoma sublateritium (strain FD-334 SS-4) TaxID=945553 RepID=A0A0D2M1Z8_HYPSF|nr:hypothetical protein HYPSUDRAFT_46682 [Hypholoma sublateritium FD-334 SS-4]
MTDGDDEWQVTCAHDNRAQQTCVRLSLSAPSAMAVYSGALQPKKKSELQEIASALRLSDQGTKDEIQARIKKHLDAHQDDLEDDPTFAGLLGRRKRSVQPTGRFAPDEKPRSARRSVTALDPVVEATPVRDMRDISVFLKHPFSPAPSPRPAVDLGTPSSLPPLPPSPAKSIIAALPAAAAASQAQLQHTFAAALASLRVFLSSSTNIWALTAAGELLYILGAALPWQTLHIAVGPAVLTLPYPPPAALRAPALYAVLLHWALPALLLPALLGSLISFNPALTASNLTQLDPLTAAITRLAGALAYPFAAVSTRAGIVHLDVLGAQWRVLAASVGLAFAFAEAIGAAPQAAARSLAHEQRRLLLSSEDTSRQVTPVRRALMPISADADDEVD